MKKLILVLLGLVLCRGVYARDFGDVNVLGDLIGVDATFTGTITAARLITDIISKDSGNLTLQTTTFGDIILSPVGYVGIGTATPAAYFSIGASSQFQVDASGNLTTSGTLGAGAITGTSLTLGGGAITNAINTNWDTAYGWGDHSAQNYFDKDTDTATTINALLRDGSNANSNIDIGAYNLTTTGDISADEATFTGDVTINGISSFLFEDDNVGNYNFDVWNGTGFTTAAAITAEAAEDHGDWGLGTELNFYTTEGGDVSTTKQMTLEWFGRLNLLTNSLITTANIDCGSLDTGVTVMENNWSATGTPQLLKVTQIADGAGSTTTPKASHQTVDFSQSTSITGNQTVEAGLMNMRYNPTGQTSTTVGNSPHVAGVSGQVSFKWNIKTPVTLPHVVGVMSRFNLTTTSPINITDLAYFGAYNYENQTVGGTVTNAYGLLLPNITEGTNNYAIKTGTGLVSFGDHVWLNVDNDAIKFGATDTDLQISSDGTNGIIDVNTALMINGNTRIGSTAAPTVALDVTGEVKISDVITTGTEVGTALFIGSDGVLCLSGQCN